jgi:hypothetical protein
MVEDTGQACFMGLGQSRVVWDANLGIRCCERRWQNSNVAALPRFWHGLRKKGVVRGSSPHCGVHRWLAMACWATGCPMEPELGDRSITDRASSTSASAQASRQVCKGTLGDLQPRGSVSTGW